MWIYYYIRRRRHPEAVAKSAQKVVVFFLDGLVFLSGSKIIVKGLENVPEDVPVLYVGNHKSIFDIIVGYHYVKNNTGFIAKDSMKKTPLLSTWMVLINCLFLNRTDVREGLKTILKGIDLVKNGTSVFIFPEGTRSTTDELLPFKEGSLKIAEKTKCPVIPVAISHTDDIFDNHMPLVKASTVVYEFGKDGVLKGKVEEQDKEPDKQPENDQTTKDNKSDNEDNTKSNLENNNVEQDTQVLENIK